MQQHNTTSYNSLPDQQDKDTIINLETILADAENQIKELNQDSVSRLTGNLQIILATAEKIRLLKATDIKFSDPILKQGDNAVIYPHTINVIQGQAGVHKSRLAEYICSALLKLHNCNNELLGFRRTNFNSTHTVVYVDTERNLSEQLPFAMQSIQLKAGYKKTEDPINFKCISLLQISRKERFAALNDYLNHIRIQSASPLFIVLDVSTDCIEDFNKTDKSMELIDLMNMAINQHNVIFLCLIHENPGSDKARGHFGTELMNKASTVMQVCFEKDANQNNTDLIKVKYLKCRSTARHAPFHIKYCSEAKGLILANVQEVSAMMNNRKTKASNEDIMEQIELILGDGTTIKRSELIETLCKEFKSSPRTIEERLKDILTSKVVLTNAKGKSCFLSKETKEKTVYYTLQPNETSQL